jgi:nickel/cobalt transporter (NicO) family protein
MNRILSVAAFLWILFAARPAGAHPMGNFSISHYTRLEARAESIAVRYLLDFAEIPTVSEREELDANSDGKIADAERAAFLRDRAATLKEGLALTVNGKPATLDLKKTEMQFRPGAGGLDTLLFTMELEARLPESNPGSTYRIDYLDTNYPQRSGWREVIVVNAAGARVSNSSAPSTDLSHELTSYPSDPTAVPLQVTEASFSVTPDSSARASVPSVSAAASSPDSRTPQDAFTRAISVKELTPKVVLFSFGLAFLFGAFHALSPGHGKAMVAAYLVGTKGTTRHALFLGGVVTLTHTLSVFALGFLTLVATQFVVSERLYPVLSGLSGATIVAIGGTLLWQRLRALRPQQKAEPFDSEFTPEMEEEDAIRSHLPPDDSALSFQSLLLLGVTGGALPCPSALVVMLGAIALHRVAFGLMLIVFFSLGLAAVLTGIGLLVVHARRFLDRLPLNNKTLSRLPVLSAALVTAVGIALLVRSFNGAF